MHLFDFYEIAYKRVIYSDHFKNSYSIDINKMFFTQVLKF